MHSSLHRKVHSFELTPLTIAHYFKEKPGIHVMLSHMNIEFIYYHVT